ncbi:MAG TPA: metal ABC transporter permease [Gemmataceae bacterium]|nr:metal ABC transporter permease [Gemmataceae bacterium]
MSVFTPAFWEIFAVLAVTAAACAVLGAFVVLRRMALLTDAIGHVLLLGIVVAFLFTGDLASPLLILGAAASGLVTVGVVEAVSRSRFVKEDAAIGLVFPALFALGVILTTMFTRNIHLDVDRVLLGSPELAPLNRFGTAAFDFGPKSGVIMTVVLALNGAFVVILFKELKVATFDPLLATTLGFTPAVLHYALMGLVSLTAVTAFDAAGPVLVVAFFVVPAAAASLLTDRLAVMIPLGVAIGVSGAFVGTFVGFWQGVTLSGTVAVVMGVYFGAALVASPRHGLITQLVRRIRQRRDFYDTILTIHLKQHEGTAAEAEESNLSALHHHLGWTQPLVRVVVARVVGRGWAEVREGRLILRPAGRAVARTATGESVS